MDWKYVVASTLIEMHQIMQFASARSCAASAMISGFSPETNIRASHVGNGGTTWMTHAKTQRAVVTPKPTFSAPRTRRKLRAPQLYPKIG